MNNKWILAGIVVLIASGCQQGPKFAKQRGDAEHRWSNARASVALRVAENRLASGALDEAHKAAEQALQLGPDSQEARIVLARVLIEKGRFTEAADILSRACQANPQDAKAVYFLGVAQEKSGRLEEALNTYRRAYGLDESDLSPIKASTEVLVALGRDRAAMLQIESYLPKAPDDAAMYELAGRLALMGKEYDKAVEYLQHLRDMDFQNVRYAELLARAQLGAGKHAQLVDNLTELLARKNYEAPTWVYLMLGDGYLAQGQGRNAFNAYFTASEREPKQVEVWLSLSRSALAMNDTPRAVGSAQRALMLAAGDVNAQLLLGCALLKDGKPARAVLVLTGAAADHPDNPTVRCLLGRAHAALGQKDLAVKCYTEAIRLDPLSVLAKQLLQSSINGEDLSKVQ
jgi:tetratricopeptide (TPR) repeat protein